MSLWSAFVNKKKRLQENLNVASADEMKYLDSLAKHPTINRLSFRDFAKTYPDHFDFIPTFTSFAKKRNHHETIGNLIKHWKDDKRLAENSLLEYAEYSNGDKIADITMPRKFGIVINASTNALTVRWADGKVQNTFPANIKLVAKSPGLKNNDYVMSKKNHESGVVINANPTSRMDIEAQYPVVYVRWDGDERSVAVNASELVVAN